MSNRYKKYFESITPDQSLMDDTIRKMQEELKSDKKAVIFDIRPVAAIAACVAVTASAVIFSPGLKKPDISDPHDQAVENVTETTANTDDDSVSASSDTSAENNTTETNITETTAASESVPSESDSSVYSTGRNEASGEKTTDRKPESTVKTSASAVPSVQHSEKPASSPAPVTKPAVTEKEQPQDPALKPEFTTAVTTSAACTVTPTPPPVMSPTKSPGHDNSGSSPNSPSTSYPSDKTDTAPTMAPTASPSKAPAWPTMAPTASPTMSPTAAPGISGGEPDKGTDNRDYIRKDVNGYTVLINYADSFINDFPSGRTEITYEYSSEIFGRDFLPRELKKQITSGYSNAYDDTYSCGMVFSIGNESSLLSGSRFINIGVSETYSPYGYLPCYNGYGYTEKSYIAGKETVFSTLPDVSDVYFCDVYTDRFQYRFTFKGYSLEEVVNIIEKL